MYDIEYEEPLSIPDAANLGDIAKEDLGVKFLSLPITPQEDIVHKLFRLMSELLHDAAPDF